jgi:putative ABC transport system permease protein
MKYLPLLWSNLARKKTRTVFTLFAVAAAFALFGLLASLQHGMNGMLQVASAERLQTSAKLSGALPMAYRSQIAATDGVTAVAPMNGFRGWYRDEKNHFQVLATDPAAFLRAYPEVILADGPKQAWFKDRTGAIVGELLAKRSGWQIGDHVPVQEKGIKKQDGSHTWYVTIDGIYDTELPDAYKSFMMIHYKFFNEGLATGRDAVGAYVLRVADPRQAPAVIKAIDNHFATSSPQTRTESQVAAMQTRIREFGNITLITLIVGAAVFFSMLLVTINTMAQSVRERIAELAVLKALGFARRAVAALVLCEAIGVTVVGGAIGLAVSWFMTRALYSTVRQILPALALPASAVMLGIALMVLFGLLAGGLPLGQVFRLRAVDALRKA